jgi:hypothetical protein
MTKCLLTLVCALPMFAANGAPSGAHYNLNIIGVEKAKTADMSGSDRHTIFVTLTNSGDTHSNIYLTPGDFQVCDGNAFDSVHDCTGAEVKTTAGAMFQLPCNTNVPADITCLEGIAQAAYEVWARALGKPGGSARMTTCAVDPITQEEICSTENVLLVRNKGKSTFTNVTNELTSLVADIDGDGDLERVALFSGGLEDFMWQYANKGLRLAQLRFYLLK